jgi:prophage antirepressor-like protein
VAIDACKALEVSNPTIAVSRLDDDEVAKFNLGGLSGESNIVSESGLYSLVLGSRKPQAHCVGERIT